MGFVLISSWDWISNGIGRRDFLEMPNKEEADKAIAALNGMDLKGHTLTANDAYPRTDEPRRGGSKRFLDTFNADPLGIYLQHPHFL